jgi:hypothetical protein
MFADMTRTRKADNPHEHTVKPEPTDPVPGKKKPVPQKLPEEQPLRRVA